MEAFEIGLFQLVEWSMMHGLVQSDYTSISTSGILQSAIILDLRPLCDYLISM